MLFSRQSDQLRSLCSHEVCFQVSMFPSQLAEKGESEYWQLSECLFSFFPRSYRFSIFSRSNAHTHTNKEGAKTRGKAERRQRAVRFTRFLDYRLMFDSGCSFSLKNDLIRPPYSLIIPRIVASPTSRSTSVFSPLAFDI